MQFYYSVQSGCIEILFRFKQFKSEGRLNWWLLHCGCRPNDPVCLYFPVYATLLPAFNESSTDKTKLVCAKGMVVKLIWVPSGSLFLMAGASLPWIGQRLFEPKPPEGLPALQEAWISITTRLYVPPDLSKETARWCHTWRRCRSEYIQNKHSQFISKHYIQGLGYGYNSNCCKSLCLFPLLLRAPWLYLQDEFSTPSDLMGLFTFFPSSRYWLLAY